MLAAGIVFVKGMIISHDDYSVDYAAGPACAPDMVTTCNKHHIISSYIAVAWNTLNTQTLDLFP